MSLTDSVREILRGIDKDDMTYSDEEAGWWETAEGAEFGARKLQEVVSLVEEAERQIAEAEYNNQQQSDR